MKNEKKVGLALSGGGYRAAAFHLGTMRKLYELDALDKVDVLSTISGGSITGAAYLTKQWDFPAFEAHMIETLKTKSVIRYVLTSFLFWRAALPILLAFIASVWVLFTSFAWLSPVLLVALIICVLSFQYKIFPISRIIEKAYDKFFFDNHKLGELIDYPAIAIGSTNIQTCRPFSFSKGKMGDSTYSYMNPPVLFKQEEFPVSKAVMASSCVPFAFAPVLIDGKYYTNPSQADKFKPVLVDGGVYDNQGIHKLTESKGFYRCDIIVASDAGTKPAFEKSFNNVLVLLIRTMDVFMARIKDFQIVTNVYRNTSAGTNREITYVSLGWELERLIPGFIRNLIDQNIAPSVLAAHNIPAQYLIDPAKYTAEIQAYLEQSLDYAAIKKNEVSKGDRECAKNVGTNLTRLSEREIDCLMRQAANITELQVKLYCPSLI